MEASWLSIPRQPLRNAEVPALCRPFSHLKLGDRYHARSTRDINNVGAVNKQLLKHRGGRSPLLGVDDHATTVAAQFQHTATVFFPRSSLTLVAAVFANFSGKLGATVIEHNCPTRST